MLAKVFPFMAWFKNYDKASLQLDALSGLTVALVLIPQSMAYAQLAGLPAYYGLYASFLPPMVAALFGSSRQLATGPVAVVSLMTAASLAPLATAGSPGYIAYAILLALMVGIFQLTLGILRLGLVVNFLSHPVVNGFTNAAAIIIASSQLSKMFGVYVDTAPHHYETILHVIESAINYTHWPTLLMGAFAFGIMYGLKWLSPRIPNVLVAVVITTAISWATGFQHDTSVGIEQIESPEVRQLIEKFNKAASSIPPLAEERTQFGEASSKAKQRHDEVAVLDAEHMLEVTNLSITHLQEEVHDYRARLRLLLLAGVAVAVFLYLTADVLVKVDRASMARGLEVRAPLLDTKVVELRALDLTAGCQAENPAAVETQREVGARQDVPEVVAQREVDAVLRTVTVEIDVTGMTRGATGWRPRSCSPRWVFR